MRDKGGEDLQLNCFFLLLFSLQMAIKSPSSQSKSLSIFVGIGFSHWGDFCKDLISHGLKTLAEFRVTSSCEKAFSNIRIRVSHCKTRVFPQSRSTKLYDNLKCFQTR